MVKLAKSPLERQAMVDEFERHRLVWSLGLPVPRAYALVEIDGLAGIVLERVCGESVLERLVQESQDLQGPQGDPQGAQGRALGDFRLLARVLAHVHGLTVDSLPLLRQDIEEGLQRTDALSLKEKARILEMVDAMSGRGRLCHGDPHPGNLLIRDGQPVMIDWRDAVIGPPEAEVADLLVLVRFSPLPPGVPEEAAKRIGSRRELFARVFLDEYQQVAGIDRPAVDAWIAPMAARRLTMGIAAPADQEVLLAQIRRRLH